MRVLRGSAASWPREEADTALAIGVFDGLHSGHRTVLAELRSHADRIGVIPGVVTFDPHPLSVVAPEHAPALITDIEQRLELFEGRGIGLVAVVAFDAATRVWSPSDFALGLLAETLRARAVLVGEDFRFGRDRTGDITVLHQLGGVGGFETVVIPLVGADGLASSSAVRTLIASGDVEAVAVELGRPHEVRGSMSVTPPIVTVPSGLAVPGPGRYVGYVGSATDDWVPAVVLVADNAIAVKSIDATNSVDGAPVRVRFVARISEGLSPAAAGDAARRLLSKRGS